jgi:hypothetical protein
MLSREELAAAVDLSAIKLIGFEIGMLALGKPDRRRLRSALELAGIEFEPSARLGRLDSVG